MTVAAVVAGVDLGVKLVAEGTGTGAGVVLVAGLELMAAGAATGVELVAAGVVLAGITVTVGVMLVGAAVTEGVELVAAGVLLVGATVTAGVVLVGREVATGVALTAAVVATGTEALLELLAAGTGTIVATGAVVLPPTTTVLGAAPVYHGAKPKPCRYSIFCHTMESQLGLVTRPPVSPEFAFQANQKKLVMGLCRASTGVPSA